MRSSIVRRTGLAGAALAAAAGVLWLGGATLPAAGDDGVIRGIVRSDAGPEAGVWVIAATSDLETVFRKIVVTGDDGRFLVPDLPDADYEVWSRGYGLIDSTPVAARPGDDVELAPAVAADPRDAAAIYPANYWYALLEVPDVAEFPGTGPRGNGISRQMRNQAEWVDRLKDGCQLCHQMGNLATREVPNLDDYDSTLHAWEQRVLIGATGAGMNAGIDRMGRERSLEAFASWTDRIMDGAVPPTPPRPAGAERNVVLTQWGWSSERGFIHDEITTDKRNPTVNANGPVYGVDMLGKLAVADPVRHLAFELDIPTRTPMDRRGTGYGAPTVAPVPSPYWGDEVVERTGPANPHNPMMDAQGRVWMTSTIRPRENPSWCRESDHPSVQRFPLQRAGRQMSYYDPEQEEFVLIDTCFDTHHLQFAEDADDTLWISGDSNVVGWINTRLYDETANEQASQGWCPTILDTNGDGRAGAWVEPGEAPDPAKDTRINGFAYGIIPNPVDGSVWVARPYPNPVPGQLVRLDPETCLAEVYEPPFETDAVPPEQWGHGPRGIDVDRNGLIWTALGGSGHLASFDRQVRWRPAERAGRHRTALPRGVDALSDPRPADGRRLGGGERRLPLLHVGRPVRHARPRGQRAAGQRHDVRLADCAGPGDRRDADAARPLPARVLHARARRPDRRSGRRLEGARRLGEQRHHRQLAQRGRQGDDERDRPLPGPPAPAGALGSAGADHGASTTGGGVLCRPPPLSRADRPAVRRGGKRLPAAGGGAGR